MHAEAMQWVRRWETHDPEKIVIELGSRNTSGAGVRQFFTGTQYIGIDAVEGPDVDVVANAATVRPSKPVDLVVCCELMEHTPYWREILNNAFLALKPGGRLILTCAGPGRGVHGVNHDDPDQPGWYGNVPANAIANVLSAQGWSEIWAQEVPHTSTILGGTDTQATAIHP